MNDNEQILAELRKIAAWADLQRKIMKWWLIVAAVVVPAILIFGAVMENRLWKQFDTSLVDMQPSTKRPTDSWSMVDSNVRGADLDEAIRIGEGLIQKTPLYPDGHIRLASAYLAAGKIETAREHYVQAFRLFPSEENQKSLIAVEKRIRDGDPQPMAPANRSQPIPSETNRTTPAPAHSR